MKIGTLKDLLLSLRPLNLLILGASLVLAQLFVIGPVWDMFRMLDGGLDTWQLAMLVVSVVLIAAGGNLLNDRTDVDADEWNKPGKNQVGKSISYALADKLSVGLMMAGLIVGVVLCTVVGKLLYGGLFVLPVAGLWAYSTKLQGKAVLGNLTVAFLAGFSFVLLGFLNLAGIDHGDVLTATASRYVWTGVGIFGGFAFLITLVRELVKDIQDMRGDKKVGQRTLPIMIGMQPAKFTAIILMLFTLRMIVMVQQWYLEEQLMTFPLALVASELLLIASMVMLWFADTPPKFGRVGLLIKLTMLAGIAAMVFYEV